MNGNRYVLDTNAIVALLQGTTQLVQRLHNAEWIGISVIPTYLLYRLSQIGIVRNFWLLCPPSARGVGGIEPN